MGLVVLVHPAVPHASRPDLTTTKPSFCFALVSVESIVFPRGGSAASLKPFASSSVYPEIAFEFP